MAKNLPYATSVGTLEKMLGKIKTAAVPEQFSQKFVEETLLMRGGTPKATMPFLKKMGFVGNDGRPTDLYKRFRNDRKSGSAIAEAMKKLYGPLFKMNESVVELSDAEVKGLIVEATGGEKDSTVTKQTLATFKALKKMADFSEADEDEDSEDQEASDASRGDGTITDHARKGSGRIGLSYTINLNLPATRDVEVFNAIFKSLRAHLLDE